MLAVDAMMASRTPPRVHLEIESQPIASIVRSNVPAEMTLHSLSAIYSLVSIAMIPKDREVWTWSLAPE
jgi:hypothetical protein